MKRLLIVRFCLLAVTLQLPCDSSRCRPEWVPFIQIGDYVCDLSCFVPACQFDSSESSLGPLGSDCFNNCQASFPCYIKGTCNIGGYLGNGVCDDQYAIEVCGWDMGDCGYCNLGCETHIGFQQDLNNGLCEEACDNSECAFDGGDCVRPT